MTRSQHANRRLPAVRRQAGQAMVLFMVLAGVLLLGVLLLFNTGQAVNKKVTLTNTADAAAYSVAVQQARVMNFAAYTNRARIANEVAVAQMVSLWSWMNMIHTHTVIGHNLFTYLTVVPYVGVVARVLASAYQTAEALVAGTRTFAGPAFGAAVTTLDGINGVLAASSNTLLTWGSAVGTVDIANEVVRHNDPTAEIAPAGYVVLGQQIRQAMMSGGSHLLSHYSPDRRNTGMDRYRNVVMASRDRLSADRNDFLGIDIPFVKIGFEEAGGTDLVDYDRWVGVDTLDFSVEVDLGLYTFDLGVDLGFGGAQAVSAQRNQRFFPGINSGREAGDPGWYSEYHPGNPVYEQYNGAGQSFVERYPSVNAGATVPFFTPRRPTGGPNQKRNAYLTRYNGLRDYHDVNDQYGQRPEGENAGPIFTVYLQSGRAHARTSEDIDGIGGPSGSRLELENRMANDMVTAVASAQTYFNRPPDSRGGLFSRLVPQSWNGTPVDDGQLEQGSLFSPYWQARLVETPGSVYSLLGLSSLVTAGGS